MRKAVGSRDGAVIVRIVDYRGEKIRGHHQGALIIQAPYSGVIRLPETDDQVRIIRGLEDIF